MESNASALETQLKWSSTLQLWKRPIKMEFNASALKTIKVNVGYQKTSKSEGLDSKKPKSEGLDSKKSKSEGLDSNNVQS